MKIERDENKFKWKFLWQNQQRKIEPERTKIFEIFHNNNLIAPISSHLDS